MEKGFTLFTALVAVMVVVLGVLITQSMIMGERSSVDIVSNAQEEAQMLDFASLRKTDAIQEFNFGLRLAFENYFTEDTINGPDGVPDNPYILKQEIFEAQNDTREEQWEKIKKDFAKETFGDNSNCAIADPLDPNEPISDTCQRQIKFAEYTTNAFKNALPHSKLEGDYILEIDKVYEPDFDITFKKILLYIFSHSTAQNDFLIVSDCDGDYLFNGCPGGGFYINLDFGSLETEVYEALPQIIVKKTSSCRRNELTAKYEGCTKVIKQPIFPKSSLRIFVPTRIFKALAGAHAILRSQNSLRSIIFDSDSEFKQRLKKIKLGVCDTDPNYRVVIQRATRTKPKICTTINRTFCSPRTAFEQFPSTAGISGAACIGHPNLRPSEMVGKINISGGFNYDPNDEGSTMGAINSFVSEKVFFELLNNNNDVISVERLNDPNNFEFVKNSSTFFWKPFAESEQFFSRPSRNVFFQGQEVGNSTCAKITKIEGTMVFEEKNDTYRINTNKATRFAITIIDDDFPAFADGSDPTEKSTDFSESKCITVITDNQISCPDPNNYWLGPC